MKILIISQYFWPENFRINEIAKNLVDNGHSVSVLTAIPNYPKGKFYEGYGFFSKRTESFDDVEIVRCFTIPRGQNSKIFIILNYFSYLISSILKLLLTRRNKNYDVVLLYQLSPATTAITALLAKYIYDSKLIYYIQDLWPESLIESGSRYFKFLAPLISKLLQFCYRKSDKILVQSPEFIKHIQNKNIDVKKIEWLPNSIPGYFFTKSSESERINENFVLTYAGNIGASQSWETIVDAVVLLKKKSIPVCFRIIGEGRAKKGFIDKIAQYSLDDYFNVLPQMDSREVPKFLTNSDALLVSLNNAKIFSLTIPTKIQAYMASGKPIIGAINGITNKLIKEIEGGYSCEAENAESLANIIEKMINLSPKEREVMGKNNLNYCKNHFSEEIVFKRLNSILNEI